MRSLIKNVLIFLIFINIVCVTCSPNLGQNSRESKEINDEEKLKDCKLELFVAFKKNTEDESNPREIPLENVLHAFLNINENSFVGHQAYTKTTRSYYHDLLYILLDMNLPTLMTPKQFCRHYHEEKASSSKYIMTSEEDCLSVIEEAGCGANCKGRVCMHNMYLKWKKREFSSIYFVPGTADISDDDLGEAFERGSYNLKSTSDNDLIQDYLNDPSYYSLREIDVIEDFYQVYSHCVSEVDLRKQRYMESLSYDQSSEGLSYDQSSEDSRSYRKKKNELKKRRDRLYKENSSQSLYEQYLEAKREKKDKLKNYLQCKQFERDLYQARLRGYGIGNVSFSDITEEYIRRRSLAMMFDNFYGMYFHDIIKKYDADKFISVTDYCKDIISKDQYNPFD